MKTKMNEKQIHDDMDLYGDEMEAVDNERNQLSLSDELCAQISKFHNESCNCKFCRSLTAYTMHTHMNAIAAEIEIIAMDGGRPPRYWLFWNWLFGFEVAQVMTNWFIEAVTLLGVLASLLFLYVLLSD